MNVNAQALHRHARMIARFFTQSACRLNGNAATGAPAVSWDELPTEEKKLLEDVFVDVLQHLPQEVAMTFPGGLGEY